jgi:hypothetical protein
MPTSRRRHVAALTIQTINQTGVGPTYAAADAAGDTVIPGAGSFLHVKNAGTAAVTVTLVTPGTVSNLDIADQPVSVPAAGERMIAVGDLYRDQATGRASVTYSAVASVTVGSFRAPVQ